MSNTDGEDTQKVSLGELLLNAGTRIVDLEKQSNDQVEIITHLEKQLASLREQLANSRNEVHELKDILQILQPWISGIGWIHDKGTFFNMSDRIQKATNLSA